MLKIRRSRDRLIFNMVIPIPEKDGLYIETGPWYLRWLILPGMDEHVEEEAPHLQPFVWPIDEETVDWHWTRDVQMARLHRIVHKEANLKGHAKQGWRTVCAPCD